MFNMLIVRMYLQLVGHIGKKMAAETHAANISTSLIYIGYTLGVSTYFPLQGLRKSGTVERIPKLRNNMQ